MVVAIDGPAGTGKSTVSTVVAKKTGFFYLNSGRFYRAITWKALQEERDLKNPDEVLPVARTIHIELDGDRFLVDGVPREEDLHTTEVDSHVAEVSSIPAVREEVNTRLKDIAGRHDIVVEGRDMSTVVFPDAEIKIFLDADPHERARRRHAQQGNSGSLQDLEAAIRRRDRIDTTKATGRLMQAKDSVYLDSTDLTLNQVCDRVISIIHEKTNHGRSN